MRTLTTLVLLFAPLATACTDDVVSEDVVFRRLVDTYDSEAHCRESTLAPCYQNLTLCTNGRATLDLASYPIKGTYLLLGTVARTETINMSFDFDLDAMSSPDLPGRHPWERVQPLLFDCGP
ncbi:MAG: hypothetical protein ACKV2T_16750 [Kofleriaceae bacterium]